MLSKEVIRKRNSEIFSNSGSPLKKMYHGKITPSGEIELVYDGVENLQEYIDSFEEETTIENIIMRVQNGEIDLLNAAKGVYIDTIGMPNTYAEVLQIVNDGKRIFEKLPLEIKEKFNNDFNQWFAYMDSDDFMEKTGFMQVKEIFKEVKEE